MSSKHQELRTKLQAYLVTFTEDQENTTWPADSSLKDLLDSLGLFMFLLGLDEEFNIEICNEHFNLNEMGTLNSIASLLEKLTAINENQDGRE